MSAGGKQRLRLTRPQDEDKHDDGETQGQDRIEPGHLGVPEVFGEDDTNGGEEMEDNGVHEGQHAVWHH